MLKPLDHPWEVHGHYPCAIGCKLGRKLYACPSGYAHDLRISLALTEPATKEPGQPVADRAIDRTRQGAGVHGIAGQVGVHKGGQALDKILKPPGRKAKTTGLTRLGKTVAKTPDKVVQFQFRMVLGCLVANLV